MARLVIIGGGISGLATAYYVKRQLPQGQSLEITVLEREDVLGGKIQTETGNGFVIEGGPDSFLTQKPWAKALAEDLGLGDEFIPIQDDRSVYILKDDRLQPFPQGFRLAVPTSVLSLLKTPLLSPAAKLRMLMDLVIPCPSSNADESLAQFIRRRLGKEALTTLAGPMMAGIYVADPEKLSIAATFPQFVTLEREHGSLIRGLWKTRQRAKGRPAFLSFKNGMSTLTDALAKQLPTPALTGQAVTHIAKFEDGFHVTTNESELVADAVVLAVPAKAAAQMLNDWYPSGARLLAELQYVSSATVSVAYKQEAVPESYRSGLGFLVPTQEDCPLLGATWTSSKFAHRAPEGCTLIRAFLGGQKSQHLIAAADDTIVETVQSALRKTMGIEGSAMVSRIYRWRQANPQYAVGHLDWAERVGRISEEVPGLHITGCDYGGVGIPDCVHNAQRTATAIVEAMNHK